MTIIYLTLIGFCGYMSVVGPDLYMQLSFLFVAIYCAFQLGATIKFLAMQEEVEKVYAEMQREYNRQIKEYDRKIHDSKLGE